MNEETRRARTVLLRAGFDVVPAHAGDGVGAWLLEVEGRLEVELSKREGMSLEVFLLPLRHDRCQEIRRLRVTFHKGGGYLRGFITPIAGRDGERMPPEEFARMIVWAAWWLSGWDPGDPDGRNYTFRLLRKHYLLHRDKEYVETGWKSLLTWAEKSQQS